MFTCMLSLYLSRCCGGTTHHIGTQHHATYYDVLPNRQRYYALTTHDEWGMDLHKIGLWWNDEDAPKDHASKWQTCNLDPHARKCTFYPGNNWDGFSLQDGFMAQAPSSYRCDS